MSNKNNTLNLPNADYRTFSPGETISRCPDDSSREVGLLIRGAATLHLFDKFGNEGGIASNLQENDWVALERLECNYCSVMTTAWIAEEVCLVAFVSVESLRESSDCEVWKTILTSALRQKTQLAYKTFLKSLAGNQRINTVLTEVSKTEGVETHEGILIPYLNRTELARRAEVGREYISRHLAKLRENGHIEMRHKGVLIKTTDLGE